MMLSEWSTITGLAGYDQEYSLPEFKEHLSADLSSMKCNDGWVFWRPETYQQLEYELFADEGLDNVSPFGLPVSSSFVGREIEDKIKFLLEEMASHTWERKYLVQFWAPEAVDQQHLYLTTSDQPFAVGLLCRGLCWYRQHCMPHRYRVDEGANEKELGSVGRVYRNLHPESSPDLRLYSTTEFPLRDYAAGCGGRAYLALPVFDLPKEKCYGVIEVLSFDDIDVKTTSLESALQAAKLRSTHLHFSFIRLPFFRDADSEIAEMLELAIRLIPQLQLAQVWVPCHECCKRSNNLSCMKRATFINAEDEIVNLVENVDYDIYDYLVACHLHNLQIGKCTNMISAVMSSNNKSCICRNVCDFSISENPLAHYARKARLSSCFAICLESLHDSRDFYVVEFFLQFNSREDAFVGSFLPLLLRIMEMKLKNFAFPYKGQHGEELAVEVLKENMLSSDESSQSSALRYESIRCKHQSSNKISKLMEECKKRYLLSDFTKYLQNAELHFLQPSETRMHGWTFWSRAREELSESEVNNFSLLLDRNQEKIKCLMSEITSKWDWNSYALAQFWAPKMVVDRCYLETSGQPFALGCLHKGLAFFRKQCMEHYYFAGETAKQEELGPPGRVFLNGHPEITPDLRLYSPTEFPLRNQAAHCGLRKYFALPVYELNQHKCVGVLELVEFSDSTLEAIKDALKAANLSSTHINFMPSFQGSHLPGNLALTEIKKARKLFTEIPQLYMVEVWVPYSECPSSNNTVICMERVWATKRRLESDPLMCQIQHVKTRKGIAGMALESENKSCFCQDLYEFTIVEQPLAHYARRARLDVCFAICLQSWHTGNLLYVLEFYLNQGPRKYEYLRSFLCLLLPIMKQELKSFKIALGQQLGEKLVVEVIEFSLVNEVAFSEIDQPDMFPITFKFVKYYGREQCSTSAAILKKKDAAKETKRGKKKMRLNISREDLEPYFGQKLEDVAKALGVSKSTIKRRWGDYDIQMWPWNENYRKNHSLFMRESARDYQQNMCLSCFHNLPPSDMPFHQNVMHTNPESTQGLVVPPKVDMVIIKATYGEDTIKFELCHSAGMEKLMKEVAMRLNLKLENFKLKYLDEDNDEILLACDADLQLCLKSMAAVGKTCIQVSVQSI